MTNKDKLKITKLKITKSKITVVLVLATLIAGSLSLAPAGANEWRCEKRHDEYGNKITYLIAPDGFKHTRFYGAYPRYDKPNKDENYNYGLFRAFWLRDYSDEWAERYGSGWSRDDWAWGYTLPKCWRVADLNNETPADRSARIAAEERAAREAKASATTTSTQTSTVSNG